MANNINILGAGIAGLTAAINLAKNGFDVTIYEKNKSIGERENICALRNYDLNKDAIKELEECGVKLNPTSRIKRVIKFSPNHRIEEFSRTPIFYVVCRGKEEQSLDMQLYRQALDSGVKILFGKSVNEKDVDIVATGHRRNDIFAYGHIYEDLNLESETGCIFYNNLYSPRGYIYLLNSNNKTIICAVSFYKKAFEYVPVNFSIFLNKNEYVRDLVRDKEPLHIVSGYGNYDVLKSATSGGRYYVGDAAFFQDASKGFGIRYAVLSGYLAAKAIIENKNYDDLWKSEFEDELKRNFKRRVLINSLDNKDYDLLLNKIGERVNIKNYLKITRKINKHIDVFFPLYLWKWKLLRK
jgi:flavin-dependent dehydrogenase